MSQGSAYDYIRVLGLMLDGKRYTRTINHPATRYNLDRISHDFGEAGLRSALKALAAHIEYYRTVASNLPSLVAIFQHFQYILDNIDVNSNDFVQEVDRLMGLAPQDIQKLLPQSGSKPSTIVVSSTVFVRSAAVVAAARMRAAGVCERCGGDAPFKVKKTGVPFLEVHHIQTLISGGDDTLDNTLAVCPNCHRELHYG